jgi:hypothetical protein
LPIFFDYFRWLPIVSDRFRNQIRLLFLFPDSDRSSFPKKKQRNSSALDQSQAAASPIASQKKKKLKKRARACIAGSLLHRSDLKIQKKKNTAPARPSPQDGDRLGSGASILAQARGALATAQRLSGL